MFIDDILIYSRSEEAPINYLRIVLKILKDQQLFVMFSKYKFRLRTISFLGQIVSIKGIEVDHIRRDVVKSWHIPLIRFYSIHF